MTGSTGTSAGAALLARGLRTSGAQPPATAPSVEPFRDVAGLQRYAAAWKRQAGGAEGLNP